MACWPDSGLLPSCPLTPGYALWSEQSEALISSLTGYKLTLTDDGTDMTLTGAYGDLRLNQGEGNFFFLSDIKTDRWLELDNNFFMGVNVVGAGNLNTDPNGGAPAPGDRNLAIGANAFYSATNATENVMLGAFSGYNTTSGRGNMFLGFLTGYGNVAGDYNIAIGQGALSGAENEDGNVAIGAIALSGLNIAGSGRNTALGDYAGHHEVGGAAALNEASNSLYLGAYTQGVEGETNAITVGYQAESHGSNTVTLGNDSITDTYLKGITHFPDDSEWSNSGTEFLRADYDATMIPFFETIIPGYGITTTPQGLLTWSSGGAVFGQAGNFALGAPLNLDVTGIAIQATAAKTAIFGIWDDSGNDLFGYIGWDEKFFVGQAGTGALAIAVHGDTLETTFADAFTFPVTDGAANTVLATDGAGNVDWQTVGGVTELSDLSDVNSSDDTAYKVLIADGSGFDSGFLDRLYDTAGTNYVGADYKASWYSTRNAMELKSGTEDLLLCPETGSGIIKLDAKHTLITDSPPWMDAPKLYMKANAGDHITPWNHSYGAKFDTARGVGEATGATYLYGASYGIEDYYSGSSHLYTIALAVGVNAFPAVGTTLNYVTGQSNFVSAREGVYGGITTLVGATNEARVQGSNSQTYNNATGVTAYAALYGSTANATIVRASSFMSSSEAGSAASAIGAITTYEHYGIFATALKAAGSTFGTQYGLRIPDLNTATTNYGIHIAAFTDTTNDWGMWSSARLGLADDIPLLLGSGQDIGLSASTADQLDLTPATGGNDVTLDVVGAGILISNQNLEVQGTIKTTANNAYDLQGYTAGAPTIDGYLTMIVDGTTYRIAVEKP